MRSLNSDEENRAIVEEIQRKGYRDRKMYFWMGLTDLSEEGIWKLVSSCENASYLNWEKKTNEPDNYGERGEGCAYLRSGGCADWDHSGWADLDCSKNGVIIQCGWSETTYSMHPLCDCQERKSGKYLIYQICHQILFDFPYMSCKSQPRPKSTDQFCCSQIVSMCTSVLPSTHFTQMFLFFHFQDNQQTRTRVGERTIV